jgi:hypothetical protein
MKEIKTFLVKNLTEPFKQYVIPPVYIKLDTNGITYEITAVYGPKDFLQKIINDDNYRIEIGEIQSDILTIKEDIVALDVRVSALEFVGEPEEPGGQEPEVPG